MSALADQIAEVLQAHERTGPPLRCVCGGRAEYKCVCYRWEECECDAVTPYDDHPAHVGERIAELFTEEERSYYDHAEPYGTAYERRFVSPWTAEETKP